MAVWNISALVACVVVLALVLPSHAQNSPQDYLNAHNAARSAIVGANIPALLYDTTLEADVQLYLSTLLGVCNINVDLSLNGINVKVKENVLTGLDAVNAWVSEQIFYDYNTNLCVGGVCNHYTQVVWKSSVSIGCFRTQCLNNVNLWIVGCKYSPPGNIIGQRPY
ncbi:basic form of pathogenesis-related protein 1 [Manihot esculenta]|uniref:SCP domain-containing protein n=1 Tax=Manihot esculenta TaxID=3983 RepID=A0A2C9V6Q0_MANES|nr:basic form of pathogenesis-related protein 1 [Manihot esculenta]OAY39376.1 hypothetical protein MANES_10G090000v8 [Manihot esculenta]